MPRAAVLLVGLLALVATGCGHANMTRGDSVAAVIKGVENPFFAAMSDGLSDAARRSRTPLRLEAATSLQDTAGQAAKLEALAADRAACYVVNPITQTNLIPALSHVPKGAPIVNIDSPIGLGPAAAVGVKITSYIGTDNIAAGRLAADAMAALVRAGGKVDVIAGIPGDATSAARIEGFERGARERFVVGETVAADFSREKAMLAAADLLRSERSIKGFFAVNDEMALGVADAVRAAGRRGRVAVVGVDGISKALEAVKAGELSATVAQYPYTIGQLGVEACLAAVGGKRVPAKLDAPIELVTPENVAKAQAHFPKPPEPYRSPLAQASQ
jgi:ABC-type sugar transport system substrate-binding protein